MTAGELTKLLDDPRPAVRRRAVAVLGSKGAEGVTALRSVLRKGRSAEARRNAVWAATRIDGAEARAAVRGALADPDEIVRQAALHSISLRRDAEAVPALLGLLKGRSAHNARAAAEALGRIGDRSTVSALLDAAAKPADRALEHSVTYALIEIADAKGTARGLTSKEPLTRRAALVALDQMDGGGLDPQVLARELAAPEAVLKETASWIVGHHPDWGGTLAGFLRQRLGMKDLSAADREELVGLLARFARAKPVQELLDEGLRDTVALQQTRQTVLKAMARSGLKEVPASWISGLTKAVASSNAELVREAVATARALPLHRPQANELTTKLLAVAADTRAAASVRLGALAAVPGGLTKVGPAQFDFLRDKVKADQPGATRSLAADVLSKARLSSEQLVTLAGSLKNVGPIELDRLVDAFARSNEERVGRALVAALKTAPALVSLRVETLKPRLAKFGAAVGRQAEELYAALDVGAAEQRAQLEKMLASLKGGDIRRGQAVFNSQKAACVSCHAIGYVGGKIGPDLTHIGQIRTERDLLESVLFPSASLVRSYEPVSVTTKNGKIYNGLVRSESADEVVLTLGADQEARIPRRSIEEMGPSKVSIMPTGLDKLLSPQDLADLVAFLKACR
jgi:putative heme-binding domain-containing protein